MKVPTKLRYLEYWGVVFTKSCGEELIGDCPFEDCENGKDHFYVNKKRGKWWCHRCKSGGQRGNFLKIIVSEYERSIKSDGKNLYNLAKKRGLESRAVKDFGIICASGKTILPVFNRNNECVNIRELINGRWQSTTGCGNSFIRGMAKTNGRSTIWICEGEWDTIALTWLFKKLKIEADVIGVMGCGTVFKDTECNEFKGKDVVFVYDNDNAGKEGQEKAVKVISKFANSLKYIEWPNGTPEKYDIDDLIKDTKDAPKTTYNMLKSYLVEHTTKREQLYGKRKTYAKRPTLESILGCLGNCMELDARLVNGVLLTLATVVSRQIPGGDSVWLYLVGPSASGKTTIVEILSRTEDVFLAKYINSYISCIRLEA